MSLLTFSACKIGTVAIMVAMCLGVGCIGGSGTSNFVMPFAHMTTGPVEEINWPKDSRDKMLAMMLKKVQVNPEPAKTFDCPVCQADPSESPHCPVCDAIRNLPVDCRFACPVCTGTYEGSNAVHYTYIQDTPAIEPSRKPNIVEKHIGKDVVIP